MSGKFKGNHARQEDISFGEKVCHFILFRTTALETCSVGEQLQIAARKSVALSGIHVSF
jgi:hypothetical protein